MTSGTGLDAEGHGSNEQQGKIEFITLDCIQHI